MFPFRKMSPGITPRQAHTPGQVQRRRAKRGDERLGEAVEEDRIVESSVAFYALFPSHTDPLEIIDDISMGDSRDRMQKTGDEETEDFNSHLIDVGTSRDRTGEHD